MSSDEAAVGDNEEYNSSTEDGASSTSEDEQFNRTPPSPNRKRHIDELASNNVFPGANQLRQPPPSATSQEQHNNTDLAYSMDPSIIDPNLHASTLSYQTMGGGSWYFQPNDGSNLQLGSAYGSFPSTAYGSHPSQQGGQGVPALPPHLAYWINHQNHRQTSDLTNNQSYYDGSNQGLSSLPEGQQQQQQQQQDLTHLLPEEHVYKTYSTRWIMLFYMSMLNLLSDWTCYSVAPIAMLTTQAFGDVDPESLVTVFLGANAVASALEPMVLGRLGLRRTVLFGSLLLMIGSIVKSGGLGAMVGSTSRAAATEEDDEDNDETWRLYFGFFLVGLSQPLYQCTPALLSASWFPENERTMATGVALNSNQLGIGCAFVFGTMLVSTEADIIPYFGLLSLISTLAFIGTALQFDDAPPTPPSDTARVIKGDLEIKIPKFIPFIGGYGQRRQGSVAGGLGEKSLSTADAVAAERQSVEVTLAEAEEVYNEVKKGGESGGRSSLVETGPPPRSPVPSNSAHSPTEDAVETSPKHKKQKSDGGDFPESAVHFADPIQTKSSAHPLQAQPNHPLAAGGPQMMMSPPPPQGPGGYYPAYPPVSPGMEYSTTTPAFYHGYDQQGHYHNALLENSISFSGYDDYWQSDDEGAEPIMTQMDHQLDIDIRDDQLVQQVKACFRRKGFVHCVVAFTTSGIIVNTLSTFMDYLVTLNGAPHFYVGVVGGAFQALIMCASLIFGGWTDHSRKYYFVILAMLVMGAFALSICNVDLDSNLGGDLRWNLLVVAVLAGPLQPISTELGVEVVYPLSENTVLVIQQLFSNLLSAAFIPVFKAMRTVGTVHKIPGMDKVPEYTFSFYMLIIIHACSTVFFATFNGTYLRYEAEEEKKAKKEEERAKLLADLHKQHGYGAMN